jgi:hypothetical protein
MSIDLKSCRDRLGELELFNTVEDTASAAEAMESFNALPPAAFVSTAAERAVPNKVSGRHRQPVLQTVSVLFALAAERADRERNDPAEIHRNAVINKLTAWRPPGATGPFQYVSYSIRMIADGLIWGECLFAAPYLLVIV